MVKKRKTIKQKMKISYNETGAYKKKFNKEIKAEGIIKREKKEYDSLLNQLLGYEI
jgi:hypothetical protein